MMISVIIGMMILLIFMNLLAMIQYFQLAYGTSDGISYLTTTDEKIDFEIEVLGIRADNEGQKLPADYADQYRAWRPVEEEPAEVSTPILRLVA